MDSNKWLNKFTPKANEYMKDPEKSLTLIKDATKKACSAGPFKAIWNDVMSLFEMVKDSITGNYKGISGKTLLMIMAAIVYFVSPVDLIFDFIPVAGYLDDVTVLSYVIKLVSGDIESYKIWKNSFQLR